MLVKRILPSTLLLPALVLAADAGAKPAANNAAGAGLLVGVVVIYLTRRMAIGGWLFYYYFQLYIAFLILLSSFPLIFDQLNPTVWDSSARYVMFLFGTIPGMATQCAEVLVATVLLTQRNARILRVLRVILICVVGAKALALAIAVRNFPSTLRLGGLTLFLAAAWAAYFFMSKRVRSVFTNNDWSPSDFVRDTQRTRAERRYVIKRAVPIALIAFVLGAVLQGLSNADQIPKQNRMFYVGFLWAFVAFPVSMAFPISKKKRAALA
jgi:hypothetical protein